MKLNAEEFESGIFVIGLKHALNLCKNFRIRLEIGKLIKTIEKQLPDFFDERENLIHLHGREITKAESEKTNMRVGSWVVDRSALNEADRKSYDDGMKLIRQKQIDLGESYQPIEVELTLEQANQLSADELPAIMDVIVIKEAEAPDREALIKSNRELKEKIKKLEKELDEKD